MPKTAPPCASRTTILNQVLIGHRMSTGSPQSIPIKAHSFPKAKMHTNPSRLFYHTAHTRADLISCVGGVTHVIATTSASNHRQLPSGHTVFSITPAYNALLIGMASPLTSCHAPHPPGGVQRSHLIGIRPPIAAARSCAPMSKHWLMKPRPTGSNKTCINAHAHIAWNKPTS